MQTQEIKAIETTYKGYKFRSRLEARWAKFFDAAEIKWEYEPEGFELSNKERYLPDFYLPSESMYIEVKGVMPDKSYLEKLERFCIEKQTSIILVVGIAGDGTTLFFTPEKMNWKHAFIYFRSNGGTNLLCLILSENPETEETLFSFINKLLMDEIKYTRSKAINAMKRARFEFNPNPKDGC